MNNTGKLRTDRDGLSILYDSSKGYSGKLARRLMKDDRIQNACPKYRGKSKFKTNLEQFLYNLFEVRRIQRYVNNLKPGEYTNIAGREVRVAVPLHNMFRETSRYKKNHMSWRQITRIRDTFNENDWIRVDTGKPAMDDSKMRGRVTRIVPKGEMIEMLDSHLGSVPESTTFIVSDEEVELKEGSVRVDYQDTDGSQDIRDRLRDYNDRITSYDWTLHIPLSDFTLNTALYSNSTSDSQFECTHPPSSPSVSSPITCNERNNTKDTTLEHVNTAEKRASVIKDLKPTVNTEESELVYDLTDYHMHTKRKFCRGTFDRGGRHYAMYQNLPSKWRQGLKRNGKPTVELDYSGLHINMLYHSKGLQTPDVDPYDVLDIDRPDAKQVMNTLLNAANYPSYYASIKNERDRGNLNFKGHTAKEITDAFRSLHSPIEDFFCSDVGVKLQYQDSKIASEILNRMDVLHVHDSFICTTEAKRELEATMKAAYKDEMGFDIKVHE